jgi:glucose uptake protein
MIPTTYIAALLCAVFTMFCWGSWANTLKMTGKWRFELFYFDYAIGVFLGALLAGLTIGSVEMHLADTSRMMFTFVDNLSISPKRSMIYAFAGGAVFNLANMLLVAAIAVAGMSIAFPVGIGLALIEGVILSYILKPAGNPMLLFGGSFVVLLAIIMAALAYRVHGAAKLAQEAATEQAAKNLRTTRGARRGPSPWKGVLLSLAAGLLMGGFYPLVQMSQLGDLGLGPYAAAFLFAIGVLVTTPAYNLFFMNLPVEGDPVQFLEYFHGGFKLHLWGWIGGMIWSAGMISNLAAASAPRSVNLGPAISYALGQGATLISTLWGLLVWKEFAGAEPAVRVRIALMLILFVAGLAMISVAPLVK